MQKLLISVGKSALNVSAVVLVIGFAIVGWFYGYGPKYEDQSTLLGLLFMSLGGVLGMLAAGSIFGLMAAVFDIQENIAMLVDFNQHQVRQASGAVRSGQTPPPRRADQQISS